jgi:hypothetical protein
MTDLKLLAASAHAAFGNISLAEDLARQGPEVLPLVAEQLDTAASALGRLTGRDAQVVIGPGVNFAQQARSSVVSAAAAAHGGSYTAGSLTTAHQLAGQLALNLDARLGAAGTSNAGLGRVVAGLRA